MGIEGRTAFLRTVSIGTPKEDDVPPAEMRSADEPWEIYVTVFAAGRVAMYRSCGCKHNFIAVELRCSRIVVFGVFHIH